MTRLAFEPLTHTYALDDVQVPSVTQVLKASGLIDFSRIPDPILEAARARGTAVHRAVHYFNEHDLKVDSFCADFPEYAGYLQSWMLMLETRHVVTVACERRVASPKHRYAGTIDWIGEIDGQGTILDFATGAPSDVAKNLQLAAYECAAREWAAEDDVLATFFQKWPRVVRMAVRLKKNGALPKIEPYADPREFSEFLTLLTARRIVERYKGSWIEVGHAA